MSDREYNYFIKKEEECSKYKLKRKKKKPSKSKINQANRKKRKANPKKRVPKQKAYLPGVYFSSPVMRLKMTSDYDNINISGFKLETPLSIDIGKLSPSLVFEYRTYVFTYSDKEKNKILDGLKWLDLNWDGEIIYQSKKQKRHSEIANELLDKGLAYKCFCSEDDLNKMREDAKILKKPFRYNRICLLYTSDAADE